jgi:hypothetical protein
VSAIAVCKLIPVADRSSLAKSGPAALAFGVGHGDPIESVPFMWRVDRESRDINRPCRVPTALQIRADSVEPIVAKRARNLFSHNFTGPDGVNEAIKVRPQMPWIICSRLSSSAAKRLARAGAAPKRSLIRPPSHSGGGAPSADSGEEVALGVACEVMGLNVLDGASINIAGGDQPCGDVVLEPKRDS